MEKYVGAIVLSLLVILSGVVIVSVIPNAAAATDSSHTILPSQVLSMLRSDNPTLEITNISNLPSSYSSQTSLSALNGIARSNDTLLVVGGSTNYAEVWTPLIGTYNLHTNRFTDLTSQFETSLSASDWYLTFATWDGSSFLIIGVNYVSGNLVPAMASYSPQSGTFTDLSAQIPAADDSWLLSGATWSGTEYLIVGYAPADTSTGVQPVMASYGRSGFTDLSSSIPSEYGSDYFLGIAQAQEEYVITGWTGSNSYPDSSGLLLLYQPFSNTFEDLSYLVPSNVYWLGTATWHGSELLVVGVTYPDTPAAGILNLRTLTYTDFTPTNSNPFPSDYYLLNAAVWVTGQTFYVVGQSQQYPPPGNEGSSAIMGSVTVTF